MIVLVKSVCIVCSKEYESPVKDKEKSLPAILDKMWTVFMKYFNLTPEKWTDILAFYKQVRELPFCLTCRNDVAQLLIFHDKLQTVLQRIERIIGNLSATIIRTSPNSQLNKSSSSNNNNNNEDEEDQIVIRQIKGENGEKKTPANCDKMQTICNYQVNKEIRRLTQFIAQRYKPEIQMFNCLGKNDVDDTNGSEVEQNGFEGVEHDYEEGGGGQEEDEENEEGQVVKKRKRQPTPGKLIINKKDTDCSLCCKHYSNTSNFRRHCLNVHGNYEIDTSENGTQRIDTTNIEDGAQVEFDDDEEVEDEEEEEEDDDENEDGDDTFEFSGWIYHQTKQGFVCASCGITRGNRDGLIKHIHKDHMSTPGPAPVHQSFQKYIKSVDLGNNKYSYLDKWIFEELPTGVWKCLACGNLAKNRKNQVLHIKNIHCPELCKFVCQVCNRGFKSRGALIKHKTKHEERRYRPKPGLRGTFIYDNKFEFTQTNSGFKCSTCSQDTTHINYMALHIKFNHVASKSKGARTEDSPLSKSQVLAQSTPKSEDSGVVVSKKGKYVCNVAGCNAEFPKLIGLQVHKGMRHKTGNHASFKCNLCPSVFKFSAQLSIHKKKFHNSNGKSSSGQKQQGFADMNDDDGDDFELDGIPPAKLQAMERNQMDYDDLEDDALISMPAADHYGSSQNGNSEEDEDYEEEEEDDTNDDDFSPSNDNHGFKKPTPKSKLKGYYNIVETAAGRKFKCSDPKCQKKEKLYDSHTGVYLHSRKHAGITYNCPRPNCKKSFSQKVQLQNHFRRQHPGVSVPSKTAHSKTPHADETLIRRGPGRPRLLTSSSTPVSATTTAVKGIKRKLKSQLNNNAFERKLRDRMVVTKKKKSKMEPEYYRTYKSSTRKSMSTARDSNQNQNQNEHQDHDYEKKSNKRASSTLSSRNQQEEHESIINNSSLNSSGGSEEQKYSCTYEGCTKSYRSLAGYDLHMKQHAGNVLKCQFCSKEYVQLNGLQYHLKTVHGRPITKTKGKRKLHWRTKARLMMEEEEQKNIMKAELEQEDDQEQENEQEEEEEDEEQEMKTENETNEQNHFEQEGEDEEEEDSGEISGQEKEIEANDKIMESEEKTEETTETETEIDGDSSGQ